MDYAYEFVSLSSLLYFISMGCVNVLMTSFDSLFYIRLQGSHYSDVRMGSMASQITSLTIVYLTVYSGADQRKHQSSASLAFVRGIHRGPGNSPHKWQVTQKMFPFDDVIMITDTGENCCPEEYG